MTLLDHLGRSGERAHKLADAICRLVKEGAEAGELEETAVLDAAGTRRMIKRFPQVWLHRLQLAAERGAFERYSVEEITARILSTPAQQVEA